MGKVDYGEKERSPYSVEGLELLFAKALKLEPPWMVTKVEFDEGEGVIKVFIDFPREACFFVPSVENR